MNVLVVGGFESLAGIAVTAGTIVLLLFLVALVGTAYKHFTGGIEWPEDREEDDSVVRGDEDDEWKYH